MKFNKWTVALAAIGVVSLASAAKAEEKASSVMTALSSTTLSGYVDTSAQWNFGTGNEFAPPYRFGGPSKADGFNLNVVQLRLEKPLDESEWAAGYRVDLWAGPDANTLGTQSILAQGAADFAIRQAYVALRAPIGNGLDFKVGVFDSIVGYESVESPNNPNYTRSYGHTIEPTTHTGVLATYRFTDMLSASVGVANTVGPIINDRAFSPIETVNPQAESYKTYMGSIALTAPDSLGFLAGSTLYGGIVNGFSTTQTRSASAISGYGENVTSYYAGATIATPVTGLRLGAAFDYLDVHNVSGETWAAAG
ncbi:MAG TPA: outer membrane beta-barrel protein, partial [Candidatus Sulfotelmatobacter sp.]|nr:outer membrane beta-barrel protein [Candidatus Sulfotelmatobacter sp.]